MSRPVTFELFTFLISSSLRYHPALINDGDEPLGRLSRAWFDASNMIFPKRPDVILSLTSKPRREGDAFAPRLFIKGFSRSCSASFD